MSHPLRRREEFNGDQLHGALAADPRRAARLILAVAGQGVVDAQLLLGQILLDGRGIQADPALARRWFEIAAAGGHAMAHNMLGRCLEHGRGGPADLTQAARRYRLAAEAGLDWGLYNLANLLATGRGVPRDPVRAFQLYRRAADLGHAKSMNLVGRFYEDGLVVERDPPLAHDWYRRSAEAGDFRGQFSHAAVLAERGEVAAALIWLRRALAGGNLNFLRFARSALLQAEQPALRQLAPSYFARAAELGDEEDAAALEALMRSPAGA